MCLFCATKLYSQDAITESNYLKEDSILWINYGIQQKKLSQDWESMPDKRDSIQNVYHEMYNRVSEENIKLARKYASVPRDYDVYI